MLTIIVNLLLDLTTKVEDNTNNIDANNTIMMENRKGIGDNKKLSREQKAIDDLKG